MLSNAQFIYSRSGIVSCLIQDLNVIQQLRMLGK